MVSGLDQLPTLLFAIHRATSSAKSMSHVPPGVCRTVAPVTVGPAPPGIEGSRKSSPSPSLPIPSVEHWATAVHCGGIPPSAEAAQAELALSPRPSEKRTMKSPVQEPQGPLLPLDIGGPPWVAEFENTQGFCWPPMYQAALKSISASGFASEV